MMEESPALPTDTSSVKQSQDDESKWKKKDSLPVSNGIEEARIAFVTKMVGTFVNGDSEEHIDETKLDEVHPLENGVCEESSSAQPEVKDEQRSLQEIELERRRIIDNQVVRRKKIDHWAFSEQPEKSETDPSGGSRFERLRQMAPPKSPPPPPPAMHESMRKYEERKQERIKCSNSVNQKNGHLDDSEESDLVDCASILEQKEQLKSFWEKRMMGDQPSPVNGSVTEVDAGQKTENKEQPQCNGTDDGGTKPSSVTPVAECPATKQDPPTALTVADSNPSAPESPVVVNGVVDQPEETTMNGELEETAPPELHVSVAEVEVHVETVATDNCEPRKDCEEEQPQSTVEEQETVQPSKEEEPQTQTEESSAGTTEQLEREQPVVPAEVSPLESSCDKVVAPPEEGVTKNGSALPDETEEDVFIEEKPEPKISSPPPVRVPTAPKHVTTVPTTEVPYSNFTTETKIAMEIREMREREEELLQMRERLSKLQLPVHREEAKSLSPPHSLQCNGHSPTKEQNTMTRTVSLDSIHVAQQSTTPLFHHARRKDVTVRPLADDETDDTSPTYVVLNESPVEREIKRAAEREEALRKEKGMFPRTGSASSVLKSPTEKAAKAKPPSTASYAGNTQRLLATSRIQQEIQEQTLREVALREAGQIQTISEERTDARVARLGEMSSEMQPKKPKSLPPTTPPPPVEPEPTRTPVVNGDGTAKLSSPTSSTSSSTSAVPPTRRLYGPSSVGGRGISMQRFIATRGKEVAFVSLGPKNATASPPTPPPDKTPSPVAEAPDIKKPPSPVRFGNGAVKPIVTSKRALTAESRIQQELMEMKAREEELRQQRVRLFGRSQPDLTVITNGDEIINGVDSSEAESVPSISNKKKTEKDSVIKGPRRRHTMIAEWEKIIQSAEGK